MTMLFFKMDFTITAIQIQVETNGELNTVAFLTEMWQSEKLGQL